jgi:hypothetical protein
MTELYTLSTLVVCISSPCKRLVSNRNVKFRVLCALNDSEFQVDWAAQPTHPFERGSLMPWWWRQYAPLKRRSTSTWLRGSTSQTTLIFTLVAARTWNLTSDRNVVWGLSWYDLWVTFSFLLVIYTQTVITYKNIFSSAGFVICSFL